MKLGSGQFVLQVVLTATVTFGSALSAQPLAPTGSPAAGPGTESETEACEDGVVLDDGSAETGYGWVPSVIEGEYVQRFHTSQFPTRNLEAVCICWIRTQTDDVIDFEIIFYEDVDGRPAFLPYAAVPASATVEPVGITETFVEVDVTGVTLPVGPSFIGARWNASVDQFFFICTDENEQTPAVDVFFRDDRSEGLWTSVFETADPIFDQHRSILVRARSSLETPVDVPALGAGGLALLASLVAACGLGRLIGRRQRI